MQNKPIGLVIAAVLVILLIVVFRSFSDTETPAAPEAATPAPANAEANPTPEAAPTATPPVVDEATAAAAPAEDAQADETEPQEEAEVEPGKGGFVPSEELSLRVDALAAALDPAVAPTELQWDCADGGIDCTLSGLIPTNQALADFAKELEQGPGTRATDRAPTVEINRIEADGDGKRFELGLYIP